ncbi:hypothetical protein SteCoe_10920 [Stentor coeruleus]|uniref:non-specific serine/threonine protein kinase n=1 Tax=Stentor coeruleus TaxID=5963 RepID=A0A1R2CEH6_9CILI|nr:hypothetical protein SteCoe_10920 [Stentor coeruleus]
MEQSFSLIDRFEVLRTLGSGATSKVKMIRNPATGSLYAVKILRASPNNTIPELYKNAMQTEARILIQLNHPNIVRIEGYNSKGVYQSRKKQPYDCIFITMELCPNGNLYDIISQNILPENVIRKYFIDILNGLSACHSQGIAHRDIKPENLLFDKNCNVKIADFGFAGYLQGRNGDGLMNTRVGTLPYIAPEIHQKLSYNGELVDVFSLGVVLFIMHSKHMPFTQARIDVDVHYRLFVNNNYRYWEVLSSKHPQNFYTAEFINLINSMLAFKPNERITLNQIRSHPWLSGPICDTANIVENIRIRYEAEKNAAEQIKSKEKKTNGVTCRGGKYYRCGDEESLSISIESLNQCLVLKDYFEEAEVRNYGSIILGITPKEIQTIVYNEVVENKGTYRVLENNNDIMISKFAGYNVEFRVRIYKRKDGLYVVNFQLSEGKHFNMIKIIRRLVPKIYDFQRDPEISV